MGRRKIEIKAIKDDRNRSVTFLKRKGGLFKKAHELSVLCSVDVAVIIFGNNKKLYEYSSGDINDTLTRYNYYNGPHEHKGPNDFNGGLDEDDDDEMGTPPMEEMPRQGSLPPHMQHQSFMRAATATPPPQAQQPQQQQMPNGMAAYHQRQHTPQPPIISRPGSSQAIRRPSVGPGPSQLHQVSQGPPNANGYAYMRTPPPINGYPPSQSAGHQNQAAPTGSVHYYNQLQQVTQQQAYLQEQRKHSFPPSFQPPSDHRQHEQQDHEQQQHLQQQQQRQQQQHQQQHQQQYQQQQQQQHHQIQLQLPHHQEGLASPPPADHQTQQQGPSDGDQNRLQKPAMKQSRSIFTPIDDSRSLLAQHWGTGKAKAESKTDKKGDLRRESEPSPRPSSLDRTSREQVDRESPLGRTDHLPPPPPRRASSSELLPPMRSDSVAGAKRPKLKVHIPEEQSDEEDGGETASPKDPSGSGKDGTPGKNRSDTSHSSSTGVVLPPPSPSASAILSAGASGPPNPFARPLPPPSQGSGSHASNNSNSNNNNNNNNSYDRSTGPRNGTENIETPISALPSRFVADALLPSPSSFYPEWGFGRSGGESANVLPSPLNFQTPVANHGPSFAREDETTTTAAAAVAATSGESDAKKRKSPEGDDEEDKAASLKRVKS